MKAFSNPILIEITTDIFETKDEETGEYVIDLILDKAGQKGTGKWTSQNALDLGVPTTTMTSAVFARALSSFKDERVAASEVLSGPAVEFDGDREAFIQAVGDALYASKVVSYAQGFALLREATAGIWLRIELRRDRPHLAGGLHHPSGVPQRHHRRLSC